MNASELQMRGSPVLYVSTYHSSIVTKMMYRKTPMIFMMVKHLACSAEAHADGQSKM